MAKRKKVRKVRVSFRANRQARRREDDLTRQYRDESGQAEVIDARQSESVRAKGDLSRKRTILVDESDAPLVDETRWRPGVVVVIHGLVHRVEEPDGTTWDCTVRRVLRTLLIEQRSSVTVGDRVWFSDQAAHHDGARSGVIERVAERRSALHRGDRRNRAHAIVANADQLLIVASVARPNLKPHLIDRYLVAAGKGGLTPIIVFNKCDLLTSEQAELRYYAPMDEAPGKEAADHDPDAVRAASPDAGRELPPMSEEDFEELEAIEVEFEDRGYGGPKMTVADVFAEFESLGYRCLWTSAARPHGIEALRGLLRDRTTVLSGQSGVGKSSLINAIQPGLELVTSEVSQESEKGRHTTTHARLLRLECGGHVVDTPGIRAFDLWQVEPGELEAYFVEFAPRIRDCRFKDCHHLEEPGCAVQAAVESGEISPRRYYSYVKMLSELAGGG